MAITTADAAAQAAALVAAHAWRGPPNTVYTWIVLLSFNLPILAIVAVVPFGERLSEALKEKSADGFGMTSYSRVTGALGAVILTAFFWAIGNVTLMDALGNRGGISQLLDAVGKFFLVGSALFLPYAFNQLRSIFPWATGTNAALVQTATAASPGAPSQLVIANVSKLSDAEVQAAIRGIQAQVTQDFAPEWRAPATLSYRRLDPKLAAPQVGASPDAIIYIGDKVNDPHAGGDGLAGYHARLQGALPYGFVFLDICQADWSVVLSHEVLELLADPTAAIRLDGPHPRAPDVTVQWAQEVCDAVQTDVYLSDGVKVCNFVNRAFFGLTGGSPKLNHLGSPQEPFKPRPGGYLTWFDDVGHHDQYFPDTPAAVQAARESLLDVRRNGRRVRRLPLAQQPVRPAARPPGRAARLVSSLRPKSARKRAQP